MLIFTLFSMDGPILLMCCGFIHSSAVFHPKANLKRNLPSWLCACVCGDHWCVSLFIWSRLQLGVYRQTDRHKHTPKKNTVRSQWYQMYMQCSMYCVFSLLMQVSHRWLSRPYNWKSMALPQSQTHQKKNYPDLKYTPNKLSITHTNQSMRCTRWCIRPMVI